MADSTPARFGFGQSGSDDRNLFLKVFGGEVLAAFDLETITAGKHQVKSLRGAKSAQFPKTWKATSAYHTPGVELLGNDIDTTEVVVTVDGMLVAHVAISDVDELISHFEVRSQFSEELGRALARTFDKNVFRQIILTSRTAADGPFPAGQVITNAALTNTGVANGADWIDAIKQANRGLFGKDVPTSQPRYFAANENVFEAIKYAKDANGQYLVINRDFSNQASVEGSEESLRIDNVRVYKTRNMPTTNETADTNVFLKYRANYATTTAVLWTPMAVATVKVLDVTTEMFRDVRRIEDFMLARMLAGHGTLRPECAVEFKTA